MPKELLDSQQIQDEAVGAYGCSVTRTKSNDPKDSGPSAIVEGLTKGEMLQTITLPNEVTGLSLHLHH